MIYQYINDETGKVIERDFPMMEDHPVSIIEEGLEYKRVFTGALHIPEYMKAGKEFKFDYTKSISGRKHFY